jgi:3-hydroxybutyryl-CoA dehydrogenase
MLDVRRNDLVAAVAGSGTMGRGIVQVLAQCGVRVLVFDVKPGAAPAAKEAIAQALARLVDKGRVTAAEAGAALGRIEVAASPEAFAPAQLVVEAIAEDLDAKRALFRELEDVVSPECILATNTSSLSVTALAAACRRPGRIAGWHFFNPVPVMRVVEVVAGELTEPWVGDALAGLAERFGHTPVRCKDTPGFVVNHAGRGFIPEALRVLAEGVADFATIDRILVEAAGFRIGPFGLMDLVGLDVNLSVHKSLYEQYFHEPRYQPSYLLEPRVAAGLLGRKTGRGWYAYGEDGTAAKVPEPPAPPKRAQRVWVAHNALALRELLGSLGAQIESGVKPSPEAVCFVAPLGQDATTTALQLLLDPARSVAVDPLFGFAGRRTLMTTPVTRPEVRDAAHGLLAADGVPVSAIRDSAGFVAQRVVAHIINVGCDIAQQGIASPGDLDRAVVLGLGYPRGPLAMGDAIGGAKVLTILEAMHAFNQDPRYRPSPWLRRRARLGVSLLTPE